MRETQNVVITLAYGDQGPVQSVLRTFQLEPIDERFDTKVHLTIAVPTEEAVALRQAIQDRTGGRALFQDL